MVEMISDLRWKEDKEPGYFQDMMIDCTRNLMTFLPCDILIKLFSKVYKVISGQNFAIIFGL